MNGLYFALRSGDEHRQLRYEPCQIKVIEKDGRRPYLVYTEDISKNRPGGLKGRKWKPKVVVHYANEANPSRCFVWLFQAYNRLCPPDRPNHAFYLLPLTNPKGDYWFSKVPIGKHKLSSAVANMCSEAGIQGFKTNHSLRATAATRLYESEDDEQLIMERTGHRSVEGVRSYKRTTSDLQESVSDILYSGKKQCTAIAATSDNEQLSQISTSVNLPQYSASKSDHSSSLQFTSCSNVTINFHYSK